MGYNKLDIILVDKNIKMCHIIEVGVPLTKGIEERQEGRNRSVKIYFAKVKRILLL
jgi:hypothetical protein